MGSNLDFDISLLLNLSSKQKPPTDLSFNLKAIKLLSLKPIAQIIFTLSENAVLSNECCVLCNEKTYFCGDSWHMSYDSGISRAMRRALFNSLIFE
jgi:hypothetical protein